MSVFVHMVIKTEEVFLSIIQEVKTQNSLLKYS